MYMLTAEELAWHEVTGGYLHVSGKVTVSLGGGRTADWGEPPAGLVPVFP